MQNVVFAVPFMMESSVRFLRAAAMLQGVRLAVVSQDPVEKLPVEVRNALAGFVRIDDGLSAQQLTVAMRNLSRLLTATWSAGFIALLSLRRRKVSMTATIIATNRITDANSTGYA